MCGIFGVIFSESASYDVFMGLQHLQHRGQDGGGISTSNGENLTVHKQKGLLHQIFNAKTLDSLTGHIGIGHTRYATIGTQSTCQLQPFFDETHRVATAHNGNIVNYHELASQIKISDPDALQSGCDSELFAYLLHHEFKNKPQVTAQDFLEGLQKISKMIVGSYAVVGMIPELGLFAFRDPMAVRPLVMGIREEDNRKPAYAFASESAALLPAGFTLNSSVQAGEVVLITNDGQVHRHFYTEATPKHCMFEWVYFARVESELENQSVYHVRYKLGQQLAKLVQEQNLQPDVVMPIPETSRVAAIAASEFLDVPYREGLIKNRYSSRTFILESETARRHAIRQKLFPIPQEIMGKKILVIDDSIVRGNTAKLIIQLLRQAGAKEIYFASTCPPIENPCYYGIDFPTTSELPAHEMNTEELKDFLGVDALIYQTLDGLEKSLNHLPLCNACLTGYYPIDISNSSARFSEERRADRKKNSEKILVKTS